MRRRSSRTSSRRSTSILRRPLTPTLSPRTGRGSACRMTFATERSSCTRGGSPCRMSCSIEPSPRATEGSPRRRTIAIDPSPRAAGERVPARAGEGNPCLARSPTSPSSTCRACSPGPWVHAAALRPGRHGDQDREAGNGRRHACVGAALSQGRRRQRHHGIGVLPRLQSRQAVGGHRLHATGRPPSRAGAGAPVRRAGREFQGRRACAPRPRLCKHGGDQSAPGLRVHHRLRTGRSICGTRRATTSSSRA